MPDHQPDSRTLNFAGDVDEQGYPLPMTVEVLQARTEKWPRRRTPQTVLPPCLPAHVRCSSMATTPTRTSWMPPPGACRLLKQLYGYASMPEARSASPSSSTEPRAEGLVDDYTHDILHTGRKLRNIRSTPPRLPSSTRR